MRPVHLAQVSASTADDASSDSLEAITDRLRAFRAERAWQPYHTPKNLAVSITIEASELLEHFQWLSDDQVSQHVQDNRHEVAAELADVAIYLLQLADVLDITMGRAIEDKLRSNAERYPIAASRGNSTKHYRTPSE
jgi:NTP pyrophosphatase (non-canonical NTP hydrolase)